MSMFVIRSLWSLIKKQSGDKHKFYHYIVEGLLYWHFIDLIKETLNIPSLLDESFVHLENKILNMIICHTSVRNTYILLWLPQIFECCIANTLRVWSSPCITFGEEALDFPYGIELRPRAIICKRG